MIFWPFLPWLAVAAWFAHLAGPAHARVSRALHGRKGGAALLTLALFVVIVAPVVAATASLVVDAISLALRTGSPIYVARQVLEASSVPSAADKGEGDEGSAAQDLSVVAPEEWSEILERLDPDDFKYKM